MIQKAVEDLAMLGRLPSSKDADADWLEAWERQANNIKEPISNDDAYILIDLLGPDECFGLMWLLISAIESTPGWPKLSLLSGKTSYGAEIMKENCRKSGYKI